MKFSSSWASWIAFPLALQRSDIVTAVLSGHWVRCVIFSGIPHSHRGLSTVPHLYRVSLHLPASALSLFRLFHVFHGSCPPGGSLSSTGGRFSLLSRINRFHFFLLFLLLCCCNIRLLNSRALVLWFAARLGLRPTRQMSAFAAGCFGLPLSELCCCNVSYM